MYRLLDASTLNPVEQLEANENPAHHPKEWDNEKEALAWIKKWNEILGGGVSGWDPIVIYTLARPDGAILDVENGEWTK